MMNFEAPVKELTDGERLVKEELAKARKAKREKTMTFDRHSAALIVYALIQNLKRVRVERQVLELTRERDLTRVERAMLQPNISHFTREELQEQVDAWISLEQQLEGEIEEFIF